MGYLKKNPSHLAISALCKNRTPAKPKDLNFITRLQTKSVTTVLRDRIAWTT